MKKITGLSLIGVLIVWSLNTFAQKVKVNDTFFILGTFEDYMGKNHDPRTKEQVDYYYSYEKPLAYYVDSLLKKNYPKMSLEIRVSKNRFEIYSAYIETEFEQYYNYKPSGSYTAPGNEPILHGVLKPDIFKTEQQRLSFLAGAYVRFGRDNDTAYCMWVANSMSKAQMCNQLLKELNCKPSYQIVHNIPTGHVLYFHPDEKVKRYLDNYDPLRKEVNKALTNMIDSMMNESKKRRSQSKAVNAQK